MLRNSEFWMALIAGILTAAGVVLVQFQVVSQQQWTMIQQAILAVAGYVLGRVISKFVKKVF